MQYKRTNLLGQVCYSEHCGETVTPRFLFPLLSISVARGLPFAFWLRSETRAREGRFALSRGRESRVTVCGVYGNLTGVWFSKRTKDFAPGECSFMGVHARHEEEGGLWLWWRY